jgi:hypothetical protein
MDLRTRNKQSVFFQNQPGSQSHDGSSGTVRNEMVSVLQETIRARSSISTSQSPAIPGK